MSKKIGQKRHRTKTDKTSKGIVLVPILKQLISLTKTNLGLEFYTPMLTDFLTKETNYQP